MSRLNISNRRERALVAAADALLLPAALRRAFRRRPASPSRILCFRLERIGDLLMTLPALAELRAAAPKASIDLVVGSWNRELAAAIPGVNRVETLDAAWLSRPAAEGLTAWQLASRAARWRERAYDVALNFEPDIRSNLAATAAGAQWTAGFASGGGGALLDAALDYDVEAHVADNAVRLVRAAIGSAPAPSPGGTLALPRTARAEAARLLASAGGALKVGVHVNGGRAIKQWPEDRFRDVAAWLVRERGATLVLTGTPDDRAQIEKVRAGLPADRVVDVSHGSLVATAAVVERLDLFVAGDTGPLHLAHAVGTPTVGIFGPSDPRRYAPRGARDRIVRIDLPCSPCNRIRQPPARCVGHTPDCLAGVAAAQVIDAIREALAEGAPSERAPASEPRARPSTGSGRPELVEGRSEDPRDPASARAGKSEDQE